MLQGAPVNAAYVASVRVTFPTMELREDKATGQCSKGSSCVFNHKVEDSGNGISKPHKQKERSPTPAPNSKAMKDGTEKSKSSNPKGEQTVDKRSKIRCQWKHCKNPLCENCRFRHLALEGKPNNKSKKGGAKGSVAMLKELTQMNCISQDLHPKKSMLRKEGQLGSIHRMQFS